MSKGGRSYSDPSYGSHKFIQFPRYTAGTRSAALLDSISVATPIYVLGVQGVAAVAGSGSTSVWVVQKNATAIGTLTFATNATAGTVVNASVTPVALTSGDILNLRSGTSTADPAQTAQIFVEFVETFEVGDN
jgi:hypothetical protein